MEGNFNPYLRGTQHLENFGIHNANMGYRSHLTYCSWKCVPEILQGEVFGFLLLGTIQILKIIFLWQNEWHLELCLLRELLPRRPPVLLSYLWPGATEPDLNSVRFCASLLGPPPLSLCGGLFCDPCWLILPSEVHSIHLGYTSLIVCGKRLGESLKLGKLVYDEILLLFSRWITSDSE